MSRPPRLDDATIATKLRGLPGWSRHGETITRTFVFGGFPQAVEFVDRLVEPAESLSHHPDVDLRYNRVIVTLSTHDQGGLTDLDFALAALIDGAVGAR
ncbi:4a-hydroxytetrahydrobiopterin dehydratase [Pseudogemmatithrix spongiicola]|uniref:Putative pterin-4-alpha-carbinolamine dehydratase n=1 Tax=Pseudogemmatithrix spongiicola TaxID=3062599 RepID=A0AA49Q5S1_9BACT|nr:4a-hydroxytetrahydrobiopterin dehydratase [Gemmatimonadaceae bacterium 'strain 138']WKW16149.1 4a-hydroxytetrahydrobiopterin dehydratase [Gemmatimonadaceae bacterium 'strain 318']